MELERTVTVFWNALKQKPDGNRLLLVGVSPNGSVKNIEEAYIVLVDRKDHTTVIRRENVPLNRAVGKFIRFQSPHSAELGINTSIGGYSSDEQVYAHPEDFIVSEHADYIDSLFESAKYSPNRRERASNARSHGRIM